MLETELFLSEWSRSLDGSPRELARGFAARSNATRRYLLGRNEHAAAIAGAVSVEAIVDDYAAGSEWRGHRVIGASELPENAIVVNCALSQRPHSAGLRLRAFAQRVINYADLMRAEPEIAPLPAFVQDMRRDVAANIGCWRRFSEALSDQQSRQVFNDIVRFRLTSDPSFTRAYAWRVEAQYFEDMAAAGPAPVFVDAGGFDGDTTEAFCRRYPYYKRVYLFEPSKPNVEAAKTRLQDFRDIVFDPRCLGAQEGLARFNPHRGSASSIVVDGSDLIDVTTIDAAVLEPVDFIKMDIEGGEFEALHGAARQIEANCPILALAIYHQACDFWRLWAYATEIMSDYRAYVRHYTEGWAETVLYLSPSAPFK